MANLKVYTSNHINCLVHKLAENIKFEQSILNPPLIMVPSPVFKKWIYFRVAENLGIAADFNFNYLENGLWDILTKLLSPDILIEKMTSFHLQTLIFKLFNEHLDEIDHDLTSYFIKKDEVNKDKAWQLSVVLSDLLLEYEVHQNEMLNLWNEDKMLLGNNIEKKQKQVYQKLISVREIGKLNKLTLVELFNKVKKVPHFENSSEVIHLFAFPQLSKVHYEIIQFLSKVYKINLYQVSFKQNGLNTDGFIKKMLEAEVKHQFRMNQVFKDKEALAKEVNNSHFQENSVLAAFKNSIKGGEKNSLEQDLSLQIAACPGLLREVETVYNNILHNLKTDPHLKLNEIAVLVSDMNQYEAYIKMVFNKPYFQISPNKDYQALYVPFNIGGGKNASDSFYAKGMLTFLNLIKKNREKNQPLFTRKDILDLLNNPCFLEAIHFTNDDVDLMINWIEDLNVFHSYSNNLKPEGQNIFSWNLAFSRLRLGRIMKSENIDFNDLDVFENYQGVVPFERNYYHNQFSQILGKFELVLSEISRIVDILAQENMSDGWLNHFSLLLSTFLKIPKGMDQEAHIRRKIVTGFNEWMDFAKKTNTLENLNLDIVQTFIKSLIKNIGIALGIPFSNGVNISTMRGLRGLPFKITYLLGMNEGEFPGKEDQQLLDLRNHIENSNYINSPTSNRFLLFETIMNTEKKIVITYHSKNLKKDEDYYPSNVISDLITYLESQILNQEFKVAKIPYNSYGKQYLDKNINEVKPWNDLLFTCHISDQILIEKLYYKQLKNSNQEALLNTLQKEKVLYYLKNLKQYSQNIHHTQSKKEMIVDLYQMRQFLINPVMCTIYRNIYMKDEDDIQIKLEEPFYSDFTVYHQLVRSAWLFFIKAMQINKGYSIDEFLKDFYEHLMLMGITPKSFFAQIDYNYIKEELKTQLEKIFHLPLFKNPDQWLFIPKLKIIGKQQINYGQTKEELLYTIPFLFNHEEEELQISLKGSLPLVWINSQKKQMVCLLFGGDEKEVSSHLFTPLLLCMLINSSYSEFFCQISSLTIYTSKKDKLGEFNYFIHGNNDKYLKELLYSMIISDDQYDYLPFKIHLEIMKMKEREIKNKKTVGLKNPFHPSYIHELLSIENTKEYEQRFNEQLLKNRDNEVVIESEEILNIIEKKIPNQSLEKIAQRFPPFFVEEIKNE